MSDDRAGTTWPLYLSREEAARYVGVSPTLFDQEVEQGLWPAATRRGKKDTRVTWYRPALEDAAALREGGGRGSDGQNFNTWRAGLSRRWGEDHAKAARGRH